MSLAIPANYLTVEKYLDGELGSTVRHEYVSGQVYAMAGASDRHNLIAANANALLNTALPDAGEVFISNMKIHIHTETGIVFYYCPRTSARSPCFGERAWQPEVCHEGEIPLASVGLTVSMEALYRRVSL